MNQLTTFEIFEQYGLERSDEPITFGLPLPVGSCREPAELSLYDGAGRRLPAVFTPLARWEDGSLRWALCDTRVDLKAGEKGSLVLARGETGENPAAAGLELVETPEDYRITAGLAEFSVSKQDFLPLSRITLGGRDLVKAAESGLVLTDAAGRLWRAAGGSWQIACQNPLRLVLKWTGRFLAKDEAHPLECEGLLTFCAGRRAVEVELRVRNPQAARHPGNRWDLGDPGSLRFRELTLNFPLAGEGAEGIFLQAEPESEVARFTDAVTLYQDSSGGENWRSPNHVNAQGEILPCLPGYEVRSGENVLTRGRRANPLIGAALDGAGFGLSMPAFWENFPKALGGNPGTLEWGIFPGQSRGPYELQGGEQKTHTLFVMLGRDADELAALRDRLHRPLVPKIDPEWYRRCAAGPALAHAGGDARRDAPLNRALGDYLALIDSALEGADSFFARRERIDEYGWRHFGDLYADHEAVFHQGDEPFVSHYNNQYDVIKGALLQFWRTGRSDWFRLARELADHVADIDIYHTDEDRYQYNRGLFWHTDHHLPAATATHRAISRIHAEYKDCVGGGPAPDHNYATGLALMYWTTGEERYREAALELVENIRNLVLGPDTLAERGFQLVRKSLAGVRARIGRKGLVYADVFGVLDGPGRASGNVLNTLLDGFLLTEDGEFLDLAGMLIRRCVAPTQDIASLDLENVELRWMYTVFLKALARYLEVKEMWGLKDGMFAYARAAFVHYACWMLENEAPYLDRPEILEFPNETWAAQELRKSDILALAGKQVRGELRDRLMERSAFFFATGVAQMQSFETRALTRPLALLMTNGADALELQGLWREGELPEGGDPEEIFSAARRTPTGSSVRANRKILRSRLTSISPGREWRWIRNRLGF
jgi:hypothetical protein